MLTITMKISRIRDIPEKLILTEHAEFDKSCKSVESPEKLTAFDQANSEEPKNQAIDPLQSGGTFSPEETLVTMEKKTSDDAV